MVFEKLVDLFIKTDQLGHYNSAKQSIMLYNIKNEEGTLKKVEEDILSLTSKYKMIILDAKSEYTNINILDINL